MTSTMFTVSRLGFACLAFVGFLSISPVAQAARVTSSSALTDTDGVRHTAAMAFDGLLKTAWAEDDASSEPTWLELSLDRKTEISSISIWPGNIVKGSRSLKECGRPLDVTITLLGGGEEITKTVRMPNLVKLGPTRVDIPMTGTARKVRISVDQAQEGFVFTNTYIAEVAINFLEGAPDASIARLENWSQTKSALLGKERARASVIDAFEKISNAQFGDADAFQMIMDYASDGAPYMRKRVKASVPYGFRAQALPPHDVALQAILKLKDANGIPALEMASMRVSGNESRVIKEKTKLFYAYQDLQSGGRRNVPAWGDTGFEKGALRGFGEPLAIQADRDGNILVVDTGNHRVQRFGSRGVVTKMWGAKPNISNAWFGGERDYYASGAGDGKGPGEFRLPVDIAIIPNKKEGDGFVVLDEAGRVQRFGSDGRPVVGWGVRSHTKLDSSVGGQGYIEFVKGKILVIWTYQAFLYTLDGEELAAWEVADGVPNGSVALKNGKVGLIIGPKLIQYSVDGFRHGSILGDELGEGFESWDATLDQDGKLWVVTDTGLVVKYKKPGKVDYTIPVANYSLIQPRIAVVDDIVYVVERDKVIVVDALDRRAKLDFEAKEAAAK
jgi:hypothetical protein